VEILGCTLSSVASIQSEITVLQKGWKVNDKTLDPTSGDLKIFMDLDIYYLSHQENTNIHFVVFVTGLFRMGPRNHWV
jgi:hypothetical protein